MKLKFTWVSILSGSLFGMVQPAFSGDSESPEVILKNATSQFEAITKELDRIAEQVEKQDKHLEKTGAIAMSSPTFSEPKPANNDALNWDGAGPKTESYFDLEYKNVQGAAAQRLATANTLVASFGQARNPNQKAKFDEELSEFRINQANRESNRATYDEGQMALIDAAKLRRQFSLEQANVLEGAAKSEAIAEAQKNYGVELQEISGGSVYTDPSFPNVDGEGNPVPTNDVLGDTEALDKLRAPGLAAITPADSDNGPLSIMELPGENDFSPKISTRQALIAASGSKSLERIFKIFNDPDLLTQFDDKKVLLAAVTIGVNPGFKTAEGYSAQLRSYVELVPAKAREQVAMAVRKEKGWSLKEGVQYGSGRVTSELAPIGKLQHPRPLVAAISPLMETEMWDYQDSEMRQFEATVMLADALKQAGLGQQAGVFNQFARRFDRQVWNRAPKVIINTLNTSGGYFGFEVGPRIQTVDPTAWRSRPEKVLERQSFPALLVIGFSPEDYAPYCDENGDVFEYRFKIGHYGQWSRLGANDFEVGKVVNPMRWGQAFEKGFLHWDRKKVTERVEVMDNSLDANEKLTELQYPIESWQKLLVSIYENTEGHIKTRAAGLSRQFSLLNSKRDRLANMALSNEFLLHGSSMTQSLPLDWLVTASGAPTPAADLTLATSPKEVIVGEKAQKRSVAIRVKGQNAGVGLEKVEAVGSVSNVIKFVATNETVVNIVEVGPDSIGEFSLVGYGKGEKGKEGPVLWISDSVNVSLKKAAPAPTKKVVDPPEKVISTEMKKTTSIQENSNE